MTKIQFVNLTAKETYLLQELISVLFELLEAVSSGRVIQIDSRTNADYLRLCDRIEQLAGNNFERPFSSLLLVAEDIDIDWASGPKQRLLDFIGKVDYEFATKGGKRFYEELDPADKDLLDIHFSIEDLKQNESTQDSEETSNYETIDIVGSGGRANTPQALPYISDDGFHITLADGVNHVIPFESTRGKNQMFEILKVTFDYWKRKASDGKVYVTKDEIIQGLRQKGINDINIETIRTPLSRLRKKLENSNCSKVISLSDFSSDHNGYCFEIRQPS